MCKKISIGKEKLELTASYLDLLLEKHRIITRSYIYTYKHTQTLLYICVHILLLSRVLQMLEQSLCTLQPSSSYRIDTTWVSHARLSFSSHHYDWTYREYIIIIYALQQRKLYLYIYRVRWDLNVASCFSNFCPWLSYSRK